MNLKLGLKPKRIDPLGRTLRLASYLPADLSVLLADMPDDVDWESPMGPLQMWGNDRYGCCVFAMFANLLQCWDALAGRPFALTTDDVLTAYSACAGFDPSRTDKQGYNPTDNGVDMLTAMKFFVNTGIGGKKAGAFVAVDPRNLLEVRAAIRIFGGIGAGVQLAASDSSQFNGGETWTIPTDNTQGDPTNGSWGGHGVMVGRHTAATGLFYPVTWAKDQPASNGWFQTRCDEAYALASPEQLNGQGASPLNIDYGQLLADLQAVQKIEAA